MCVRGACAQCPQSHGCQTEHQARAWGTGHVREGSMLSCKKAPNDIKTLKWVMSQDQMVGML